MREASDGDAQVFATDWILDGWWRFDSTGGEQGHSASPIKHLVRVVRQALAAGDFNVADRSRIASLNINEVQGEGVQQNVSKAPGDALGHISSPDHGQGRESDEVPHRVTQPKQFIGLALVRRHGLSRGRSSAPQLTEELVGRDEKRVLLQDAADDDHRMRAHNVHDDIALNLLKS